MQNEFTPLTVEDFGLTPQEKETLVKGAQHFLPPTDEQGDSIPQEQEDASRPEHSSGPKPS